MSSTENTIKKVTIELTEDQASILMFDQKARQTAINNINQQLMQSLLPQSDGSEPFVNKDDLFLYGQLMQLAIELPVIEDIDELK